jgi:hypothetical protein
MKKKFRLGFTPQGLAIFLISLFVLIRSLADRNVYEIFLSSSALVFLIIMGFRGAWALRRLTNLEALWKPPLPLTAAAEEDWLISCPKFHIPLFFRIHFLVKGRFFPQGFLKGCAVFAETSLPRGSDTANLALSFPLGGVFQGEGSCRLRDIFGFFSFPCGIPSNQTLKVRSAPCSIKSLRIDALSGAEDRRTKSSSNEERYYMREYSPGDRFRDINWKSSERIDSLITRITPDNQEKVMRIEIYFRSYGPSQPGIADAWLLDRAKARLAWFLRSAKEEKAGYIFNIHSPNGAWELKDQEEIDVFLEEFASVPFSVIQNEGAVVQGEGKGELYVFSTACDLALPAFLLAQQGRPVSLFLAENTPEEKKTDLKSTAVYGDCDYLRLRAFAEGFVPFPCWFLPTRKQRINVNCGRMMIDYAEICI